MTAAATKKRNRVIKYVPFKKPVADPRPLRDDVEVEPTALRDAGLVEGMTLRRTAVAVGEFDEAAMTITAVVASNTPVQRRDNRGVYTEVLDPEGVDLSIEDAPFLDSHNQRTARASLGRAFNFRREGDSILADLRFSLADDVAPIRQRVADGTLKHFSIGYVVRRWLESTAAGRVRTAAEWRITEVSLVTNPADPTAKKRNNTMLENDDNPELTEPTPAETRAEIRQIARAAGMTTAQADDLIDRDLTPDQARAEAFDHMQTRGRQTPRIRTVAPAADEPAVRTRNMTDALFNRVAGGELPEAARQYVGHSLRDFARDCVEAAGVSTRGMNPDELFRAAMHTTSDFPQLLTGVGRRTLLASYQAAQSPLKALARQGTRSDFRTGSSLRLGELGALQKVTEAGEIKHVSRAESAEAYALDTYGALFSISRKALMNDDLGAFNDWARAAGQASAQTEAALLYSLLSQSNSTGPLMSDGKRLFHADHGNLLAGAALSEAALSDARLALRLQTGTDGKTRIQVVPKFLVVGPELETTAEKLLTAINATTTDDVNPFAGKLTLAVEPRITDDSWYLFADPASVPVLEYAYLSSAPGPQMSTREGWEVLATEYRVVLDFGAGAIDHRGAVRNPGA
jgi:phage major head subunit gpT-like protein/phage head maturation protease